MMTAFLTVRNLTKTFRRETRVFEALKGASLTLSEGEFAVLQGPSGSGKSTLVNILLGLMPADAGLCQILGKAPGDDAERNRLIGYVPQANLFIPTLTVLENVCLPWFVTPRTGDVKAKALSLLESLGLTDLASSLPSVLSGGEARRAACVRALVTGPKLIIADEPTSGLDPANALKITALLREAADAGAAVLMVSHDEAGTSVADRFFELNQGVLTERKKPLGKN